MPPRNNGKSKKELYACDGPDAEKGKWFQRAGTKELKRSPFQTDFIQGGQPAAPATEDVWEELPVNFDVFSVPWQERKNYRYEGPEIIYTFWANHGPCQRAGCGHRTPIIYPQWLEGCPKHDEEGREYGGSATDSVEATIRWNNARTAKLRLLEPRGKLAEQVTCPQTKVTFRTDIRGGTAPLKKNKKDELVAERSTFACAHDGTPNDVQESVKATNKPAPMGAYLIHGYSHQRDSIGAPYSGRFFAPACDPRRTNAAAPERSVRKDGDIRGYWPTSAVLVGAEICPHDVQGHQLTHWWKLFGPLQRLSIAQILKSIVSNPGASWQAKECVLDAFQQYIRNQNLFCFYDRDYDKLVSANRSDPNCD